MIPAAFDYHCPKSLDEAVGLLALCRILFGGFRGHGGCHRHMRREHWQHWQAWQRMTPEEREQIRDGATPPSQQPTP